MVILRNKELLRGAGTVLRARDMVVNEANTLLALGSVHWPNRCSTDNTRVSVGPVQMLAISLGHDSSESETQLGTFLKIPSTLHGHCGRRR